MGTIVDVGSGNTIGEAGTLERFDWQVNGVGKGFAKS